MRQSKTAVIHRAPSPYHRSWCLVLDPMEVYANDPGQGTPAVVCGPGDTSGTYNRVMGEGTVDSYRGGDLQVPPAVLRWLENMEGEVERIIEDGLTLNRRG